MKACFKCGKTFPVTEFYVHPQMSDGHLNKCKTCTKEDTKASKARRKAFLMTVTPEMAKKMLKAKRRKSKK